MRNHHGLELTRWVIEYEEQELSWVIEVINETCFLDGDNARANVGINLDSWSQLFFLDVTL